MGQLARRQHAIQALQAQGQQPCVAPRCAALRRACTRSHLIKDDRRPGGDRDDIGNLPDAKRAHRSQWAPSRCTRFVFSCRTAGITSARRLLVGAVLLVDLDGKLIGIVSYIDALRALTG